MRVSALYCVVGETTGLGLLEVLGVSPDLVVSFEFLGFLWFSSTSAAALCFSAGWLNP